MLIGRQTAYQLLGLLLLLPIETWGARPTSSPRSVQPATTRTSTRPSGSLATPKDALKWLATALRQGDVERLRAVVYTASPSEESMITAMAEMAGALAALHEVAEKAFGAEAADRFTDDSPTRFEQTLARIDAAEVIITGDTATARYAGDKVGTYELRRIDALWKIPATQFSKNAPEAALSRRISELGVQSRIIKDLAAEIPAGRYKNAELATQAWRNKMMAALGIQPTTATRPTTTTSPRRF